ncbi:MAG: winged helix-turn-helix domain-containing protein [Actinomycetota bacterium]|nr:winged helix-turn-helix domain-containing protein [Actinomycetota bacterium]
MDGDGSDETVLARGRALSSPLRMRILRICLHRSHTNKEIADLLGLNPASTLHHVRTLVRAGFLLPQEPRAGNRGAKEIPYLAGRMSLHTPVPNASSVLLSTFLQEIEGQAPGDIELSRLGIRLNAEHRREMLDRFNALVQEYAQRPADDDGVPTSILFAHHLDRSASDGAATGS